MMSDEHQSPIIASTTVKIQSPRYGGADEHINPAVDVVPKNFYSAENSDFLLSEKYDYVLDAIDHNPASCI
jgi:tRNA A37 threonylcarbamoyladenosine dehydratase